MVRSNAKPGNIEDREDRLQNRILAILEEDAKKNINTKGRKKKNDI